MRFSDVAIPLRASWSSPFARWQGPTADVSSLELAEQVTKRALADREVEWPICELVLGMTVPQREAFYGAPTLAARLGLPGVSGPIVAQACATSVAALHVAAASQSLAEGEEARLIVTTDRTSNGPHVVYPRTSASGGTVDSENWVLDSFQRDPNTNQSMLATAERVASEAGLRKDQLDELTARRYQQYEDALADDRAFQRKWMVPIEVGRGRKRKEVDADWGVRPTTLEDLAGLKAVAPEGVVSYGSQTHPADGAAGMLVTSEQVARDRTGGPIARVLATGFARVEPGTMPKAPVPAADAALHAAGLSYDDIHIIKTHNPFIVNDLWFARQTGVDPQTLNPYGCSLIYGHPQGPTGARGVVELIHALEDRGGGIGLFTGCAAGDTGAAVVLEVAD
jgi:acetyl-CoA acetyltransferase family protein